MIFSALRNFNKINLQECNTRITFDASKRNNMKTTIQISKNFSVDITIYDNCVFVTTLFDGRKITSDFSSIEDCIKNSTIVAVKNYLKSI